MAEISRADVERLCDLFLPQLNAEHGTQYQLTDEPDSGIADFTVRDLRSDEKLPVQHVRVMGDPVDEIVKPEAAVAFMEDVREELKKRGCDGLFISMNVGDLPRDKSERHEIAVSLAEFIEHKSEEQRPSFFSYDQEIDGEAYEWNRLVRFVPGLEIFPRGEPGLVFGLGFVNVPSTVGSDEGKIKQAIKKKTERYGEMSDVILLVEAVRYPVWIVSAKEVHAALKGAPRKFREIWLVNDFPADRWAMRLA